MVFRRFSVGIQAVQLLAAIVHFAFNAGLAQASPLTTGVIVKFKSYNLAQFGVGQALTPNIGAHRVVDQSQNAVLLDADQVQNLFAGSGTKLDPCTELSDIAEYCEPNYVVTIDKIPNDPMYSTMWELEAQNHAGIAAPQAWEMTTGSDNSVVAVLDTGIDYTHPDLAANVWTNPGEIAGNGIDDDGDGYIDDIHGINAAAGTGNPYDDNVHGTHVSGTIGAAGNDGVGVAGVNWKVKIIGIKFMDSNGAGSTFDAIKGIDYAVNLKTKHNVNILAINASWGGSFYSKALEDAVVRANSAGILFVAAAGNASLNLDQSTYYPASLKEPNVISVASVDQFGNMSGFSNYGKNSVDIAAPGANILSTAPGGGYIRFSGTSMAAPHVTGAIALLNAWQPDLDSQTLKQRILNGASELASITPLVRTGGVLNLVNALNNVPGNASTPGGDLTSPPPTSIASLKTSHKVLTAAHQYSFVVSAASGDVVRTRFVLNNKACNLKSIHFKDKRIHISLRVPPSQLAGDLDLEAVNVSGLVEDSIALRLRPEIRRASRASTRTNGIKLTRASARIRDEWCRVAKKSLRAKAIR